MVGDLEPSTGPVDLAAEQERQRRGGPLRPGRPVGEHVAWLPVDWTEFSSWCTEHGHEPLPAAAISAYLSIRMRPSS